MSATPLSRRDIAGASPATAGSSQSWAVRRVPYLAAALALCLVVFALAGVPTAEAELHSYVDDQGLLHATDNWASIPERYRNQSKQRETRVRRDSTPSLTIIESLRSSAVESTTVQTASERPAWSEALRQSLIRDTTARNAEAYVDFMFGVIVPVLIAGLFQFVALIALVFDAMKRGFWGWALCIFLFGLPAFFYLPSTKWSNSVRWAVALALLSPYVVIGYFFPEMSRILSA